MPAPWVRHVAWRAVVIVAAGLFVFAPVFHGGWLMDDNREVWENASLRAPDALARIWRGESTQDYLPLKTTLIWGLWRVCGENTAGYHLTSIALHLASALLLWRLFHRLGMSHAWVGGLLFAVHPIVVESVAWVSEIKNTLSLALLLLAMLAWMSYDEKRRWPDYALALALFIAALLCKASVVMWPVVILLYAWWKRGRIGAADVKSSVPFFAVAGAAAVATVSLQGSRAIGHETLGLGGPASRVALSGMNLAFYLWKIVLPTGLLPTYPRWRIDPPGLVDFLPWPVLALVVGWLWTRRRTVWARTSLFGLAFFVVNAAPVLGFFRMAYMRITWASDHLIYLPSVGIIGLFTAAAGAVFDRVGGAWRWALAMVGWLALGALTFTSHRYAEVYSSMEAMCRYTIQYNPGAWNAQLNLAVAEMGKNHDEAALEHANAAVQLKPDVAEAQNTLANALAMNGQLTEAVQHYRQAIRLAPDVPSIPMNLATVLMQQDRKLEALRVYETVLQAYPDHAVAHCNIGVCLFWLGRLDEAIAHFQRSLELEPGQRDTVADLDVALKSRANIQRASQAEPPR